MKISSESESEDVAEQKTQPRYRLPAELDPPAQRLAAPGPRERALAVTPARVRSATRSNDNFVRGFEELRKGDVELAGEKGANLGELTAGLFPVPRGFVITTAAYRHAMERAGRREQLVSVCQAVVARDAATVAQHSLAIRSSIARTGVPSDLQLAITSAYRQLGDAANVAVRASMVWDDRAGTSLRGVTETFTNVTGEASVLDRVVACWMNLWSQPMIGYRALWGQASEPTIAVVVQRMMTATKSGVLLTTDPSQPDGARILVDAQRELGADRASELAPDSYTVRKADHRLVETRLAGEPLVGGQVAPKQPLLAPRPGPRSARLLTHHQVFALASIGADLERHYGQPQEAAWVFQDGTFYLLRSRALRI